MFETPASLQVAHIVTHGYVNDEERWDCQTWAFGTKEQARVFLRRFVTENCDGTLSEQWRRYLDMRVAETVVGEVESVVATILKGHTVYARAEDEFLVYTPKKIA